MRQLIIIILLALPVPRLLADNPVVGINSSMGYFEIELFQDVTPKTVENFLTYVNEGEYVGTFFHRSVPGFVVQGGGFRYDPATNTAPGVNTNPPVVNEFERSNLRGTVAMAKQGGDPDSATSQWFVNLADNSGNLDNQNGGFTVFGQIVGNGMVVVDSIAALPRVNFGSPFDTTPTINYVDSVSIDIFVNLNQVYQLPESVLDVDGNNEVTPLTDGLMIVRHLFGMNDAFDNTVTGVNPGRTPAERAAYLDGLTATLDIDENGTTDALEDGLLILRHLLGFTGTTLIDGSVDPDCQRCTGAEIRSRIAAIR